MFKRNLVKQESLKDCGPSCLLMIIKHYKGYIDIETLKEMCKTTKTGTTAYHLLEAAKKIGFDAYGFKCELNDINKDNIILPCIAHVIINSYNHYVVIEKIDFKNKRLLIKDPMNKIKYYTYEDFDKIFNNVILQFTPYKKIKNLPQNSLSEFILNIIKPSTNQLIQIIIISIFITLFSIITTFYMQNMIDSIMSRSKVILIFILFLIIYILKIISDFFRNKLIILVNQKVDLELNYNTFKQIINLPYSYYRNHTTGEIISKIDDLDSVRQVISKVAISLFIDLPLTLIALIVMYLINKNLFFISFIILLLYLIVILLFKNKFNNCIENCILKKSILTSFIVEAINGFETIKGTNSEKKIIHNFENKYSDLSNNLYKFDNCYNVQYLLKELINNLGFLIIILVGIFLVIDNKITIGQLISFNSLLVYFLEPIRNIIDLDSSLKQSKIALTKILHLYYKKEDASILDKSMEGAIEFKNLKYTFDDVNYVLDDVSFKIKQNSKVMVLGSSGSGKSTLFKLLKKYYQVNRNKIYINNIDINDYKKSDIIYISQNEILFNDTILNNIGNNIDVSKICLLDEIVKNMPLGYNTLIEENGFNISGGEKQRIVLARALNNNFNILIIDEGLNQVDVNMERIIIKNIFKKYKNKTIIYISHRIDNMDLFDQVIRLEKGKMISNVSKN